MGRPGDFEMQLEVLKAGLALFSQEAPVIKILDDINYSWVYESLSPFSRKINLLHWMKVGLSLKNKLIVLDKTRYIRYHRFRR